MDHGNLWGTNDSGGVCVCGRMLLLEQHYFKVLGEATRQNGYNCCTSPRLSATLAAFLLPAGTNVWLVLAAFPVVVTVLYIGRYFLKSSRELKRLEAMRCSPVYSHISETILGLEVIRASRMGPHFLKKFYRLVIWALLNLPNSPRIYKAPQIT